MLKFPRTPVLRILASGQAEQHLALRKAEGAWGAQTSQISQYLLKIRAK